MERQFENNLKIGMLAPKFDAITTFGNITLDDYKGKWLVFFSHPGDFTPVCTTEFLAFSSSYDKFKEINTELLGLSIDSNPSHLAWIHNIYNNSNIVVPFPIIADITGVIASKYNMNSNKNTDCVRSVYIIDQSGVIRAILTYPKEVGRNIDEILRLVIALQNSDKNNTLIPANWIPNMPTVIKPPSTYEDLTQRMLDSNNFSCFDWYLCFIKNEKKIAGGDFNE